MNEDQNNSQTLSFSLNFPTLFKTTKDQSFGSKTLLKTCCKTLVKLKILLSKNLVKSAQEVGIYRPTKILPVAIWKSPDCPSDRPPGRPVQRLDF